MRNRRVVVTRRGGPETIEIHDEEIEGPPPGHVQVRVLASGVAYGDAMKRRGLVPGIRPPFTPGYDLVGEVESGGPGAARFHPGERVAAFVMNGANSERVHVPEHLLVPVPADVDPAEAVALVLNYVTGWQLLHRVARIRSGQQILVHGAGGGVGTALLDLARVAGVDAFGTASERKHAIVSRFGAIPIDYRREDFVAVVRARTPHGVDVVFDHIGGRHLAHSRRALRRGGRLVVYGVSSATEGALSTMFGTFVRVGVYAALPGIHVSLYGIGGRAGREDPRIREDLARIFALRAERRLSPMIGARLPLDEARRAHEMLERAEVGGKIVLTAGRPESL
jgi:NADPH:quinone reductase-like Zn-dependent oxidoreductase